VHDDAIALGDLFKDVPRPALRVHEVLGNDLEPIDLGLLVEDVREMHGAQADAKAEIGVSETRCDQVSSRTTGFRLHIRPWSPYLGRDRETPAQREKRFLVLVGLGRVAEFLLFLGQNLLKALACLFPGVLAKRHGAFALALALVFAGGLSATADAAAGVVA